MAAELVRVNIDAAKFLSGDRLFVNFSAILTPGAEELVPDLNIDLFFYGSFPSKRLSCGLADMLYRDMSSGTFKKSVMIDNVPMVNVGILTIVKLRNVSEPGHTNDLCYGGRFLSPKVFNLTGNLLKFTQTFPIRDKVFSIQNETLTVREDGIAAGEFDISFPNFRVHNVFLRLFRTDLDDAENFPAEVYESTQDGNRHVRFYDAHVRDKTAGVWSFRGTMNITSRERTFLVGFINDMSWEVLALKELSDKIEAAKEWDFVSRLWKRETSAYSARYTAIRTEILRILAQYETYFGPVLSFNEARGLLGENIVSSDALDLFFDFCFAFLAGCEEHVETLDVFDLLDFELTKSVDVNVLRGVEA